MVLAIPRDGKTYVGTTDTTYTGDFKHPRIFKTKILFHCLEDVIMLTKNVWVIHRTAKS